MNYTPDQQLVIDTHHENILVAAAAGSGKTAVLVEHIIRMISSDEEPIDIDRLLVVTFTNAAAAEMRERIGKAINEQLMKQPENAHLQRQATLIHHAQITTIDSFCLYLLRNHFQEIGLDPSFRVADPGELKLLQADVLKELLEDEFQKGDEAFLNLVEFYCTGKKETELENAILDLYRFAMSYPWPEAWLEEHSKDYRFQDTEELRESDFIKYGFNYAESLLPELISQMQTALEICREPDGPYVYDEMIEGELEELEACIGCKGWSSLRSAVEAVQFGRLSSKKDDSIHPAKRELVKGVRAKVKEQVEKIRKSFFELTDDGILHQCSETSPYAEELVHLTLLYKERFDAAKQKRNMIDFGDMEHLALKILCRQEDGHTVPSDTALEYRDYFEEIMIDEYQDSNLVQETLLTSIARDNNLFMVGDVKQSIYRFRLARPELFMEKYHSFSTQHGPNHRIDLHQNFRSRAEVIDSVNLIFRQLMGESLGGIEYDDAASLKLGATYPDHPDREQLRTELVLREKANDSRDATTQEAELIADRIEQMMRGSMQVTDKASGALRAVRYSDMVILVRAAKTMAPRMKEVLEARGIPCHINAGTGYFQTPEIREITHLLRVIDNPQQDIPLFAVLRSVFGGFSDEELARIRVSGKKKEKLYLSLKSYEEGDALTDHCHAFLSWLHGLREKKNYLPISELLAEILDQTHYVEYVSALPGGEQRRANVLLLLDKAANFERTSFHGLYHFVRYIDQMEKVDLDDGEASMLDENANVVRIMTVHKSKGLEFPICFVSGIQHLISNSRDAAKPIHTDMDLGLGMNRIDPKVRVKYTTLRKEILQTKQKTDNFGEELRVLYVALTRAKEKLIMTGIIDEKAKFMQKISQVNLYKEQLLPLSYLNSASSWLDWIGGALARSSAFNGVWEAYELLPPEQMMPADVKVTLEGAVPQTQQILKNAAAVVKDAESFLHRVETATVNESGLRTLQERLQYQYPYAILRDLHAKTTVSELKMAGMEKLLQKTLEDQGKPLFETDEIGPILPRFLWGEDVISGTERGSAMHRFMELIDLQDPAEEASLRRQLQELTVAGTMTEGYANAVSLRQIITFLQSDLAAGMRLADREGKLHREQPFVMSIPAGRLNAAYPSEERVLVQGIIDVYYEAEDGSLVLADYKTDRVKSGSELIERYRVQMEYYAEALSRITGKRVSRKVLYSFHLGQEIEIPDAQ